MATASAAMTGLGAATQLGQGIASGVKGQQAAQEADRSLNASDQAYRGALQAGTGLFNTLGQTGQSFANPTLQGQILDQAQTGGVALGDIYNSGADALGNRALANQAAGLLGQGGMEGLLAAMNQAGGMQQFQANNFDFSPTQQVTNQTIQSAMDAGQRARDTALEQAAMGFTSGGDALDAALAARGISRNSGVGAAALSQMGAQAGQSLAELNRSIADQTQQAALQGAQLDINSALQMAGLGSNYNLGMNQLGLQNVQGQNNLLAGLATSGQANDLARAQGLAGLQGLNDQATLQQTQMRAAGVTDPLGLLQGIYQQNYLNPQMQFANLQTGLAGTLLGGAFSGMDANNRYRLEGAQQAGSGKGAGTAGGFQGLGNAMDGKNAGTAPVSRAMPGFGVTVQ